MSNRRHSNLNQQLPSLRQVMRENAELKKMLKFQSDEIERLNSQPVLARPADLEDWINEVALGDMDADERAEWDAMDDGERENFVNALGQRLAAVEKLPA